MTRPPAKGDICAVIVTFDPDTGFSDRLSAVSTQVGRVLVVDNRSEPSARDLVRTACQRHDADLIPNEENAGVAAALNQGVSWAGKRSFRWVLALDQDSTVEAFLVEELAAAYGQYPENDKVAVVGSNYVDEARGKLFIESEGPGPAWIEQTTAITSGSLLSVAAFDRIGPFREDFFIDHVDDEYCLRARSMGFKVILCRRPAIRHPIGAAAAKRLFGKSVWTSRHSAARRYYMIRNFTVLARRYAFSRPGWILSRAVRHIAFAALAILLEKGRRENLRSMAKGMKDGLAGRMGRYPA